MPLHGHHHGHHGHHGHLGHLGHHGIGGFGHHHHHHHHLAPPPCAVIIPPCATVPIPPPPVIIPPSPFPPPYPGSGFPSGGTKLYVPGGLSHGRVITANLTPGGSRFSINFCHHEGGDIAFHFNPRLPEGVVVRNSRTNGVWQHEERHQPYFPFSCGHPCTIMILCEPTHFKIAVNGQHFTEYYLRTPGLHMIQFVEIEGDFSYGNLQLQ